MALVGKVVAMQTGEHTHVLGSSRACLPEAVSDAEHPWKLQAIRHALACMQHGIICSRHGAQRMPGAPYQRFFPALLSSPERVELQAAHRPLVLLQPRQHLAPRSRWGRGLRLGLLPDDARRVPHAHGAVGKAAGDQAVLQEQSVLDVHNEIGENPWSGVAQVLEAA